MKRGRKQVAAKSVSKAHGANSLKCYWRRCAEAQVMVRALERRRERLMNWIAAEIAICTILHDSGVLYESEAIISIVTASCFVTCSFAHPEYGPRGIPSAKTGSGTGRDSMRGYQEASLQGRCFLLPDGGPAFERVPLLESFQERANGFEIPKMSVKERNRQCPHRERLLLLICRHIGTNHRVDECIGFRTHRGHN